MSLQIVSGGQTGVDRAALDAAIALEVPHGGWCPAGRWAEDGPLAEVYDLRETPSSDPAQRTEWNVRDSEGTLVITLREKLVGGTQLTKEMASRHGRPLLWVRACGDGSSTRILDWIRRHGIRVLNIAGSRESEESGVYAASRDLVDEVLKAFDNCS